MVHRLKQCFLGHRYAKVKLDKVPCHTDKRSPDGLPSDLICPGHHKPGHVVSG